MRIIGEPNTSFCMLRTNFHSRPGETSQGLAYTKTHVVTAWNDHDGDGIGYHIVPLRPGHRWVAFRTFIAAAAVT